MKNKKRILGLAALSLTILIVLGVEAISLSNQKSRQASTDQRFTSQIRTLDKGEEEDVYDFEEEAGYLDEESTDAHPIEGGGEEGKDERTDKETGDGDDSTPRALVAPKEEANKKNASPTDKKTANSYKKTNAKKQKETQTPQTPSPTKQSENESAVTNDPLPLPPTDAPASMETEKPLTCSLTIRCDNLLKNLDDLKKGKEEYLPPDGLVYRNDNAVFTHGESVYDLLKREMKENGIPLAHKKSPLFDAYYIEGIANLFEFDCGSRSGWIYHVNGVYPNFACNEYQIKDGDEVRFDYTCNSGEDIVLR